MRKGAGAAVIVGLDTVSVLTAAQFRIQEKEVFLYNEISALGHHTKAYQDQPLRKGMAAMSLALRMHHDLIR
jgi:hypothetical protein